MEIFNNNRIHQAANIYKQQDVNTKKTGGVEKAGSIQKPDSIELSPEGQEISRIKTILDNAPDVREQMVEDLRSRIENGTYKVDSKDIAKAMLDEIKDSK